MHYAGRVADVAPWIRIADLCLAPIFSGSGTRIKVLEYMAAPKPVVATAKALEGIEAVPGRDVAVSETLEETVQAILSLVDDPGRAAAMGRCGGDLVRARYSWDRSVDLWRREIAALGGGDAP